MDWSSRQITSDSHASSRSHGWEPRNPAPPVTNRYRCTADPGPDPLRGNQREGCRSVRPPRPTPSEPQGPQATAPADRRPARVHPEAFADLWVPRHRALRQPRFRDRLFSTQSREFWNDIPIIKRRVTNGCVGDSPEGAAPDPRRVTLVAPFPQAAIPRPIFPRFTMRIAGGAPALRRGRPPAPRSGRTWADAGAHRTCGAAPHPARHDPPTLTSNGTARYGADLLGARAPPAFSASTNTRNAITLPRQYVRRT